MNYFLLGLLLLSILPLQAQTLDIENGARLEYKDEHWTFYEAQTKVPTRFKRFVEDGSYLWIFNDDDRVGLLHKSGKLILGTEYLRYQPFGEGKAWVEKKTDKGLEWQAIDSTGKLLYAFPFADAQPFYQRLSWVLVKTLAKGERWGLMGDDGYEKYPPIHSLLGERRLQTQLVADKIGTDPQQKPILRWGWVYLATPELVARPIYERVEFLSDSLLAVMTNNQKWMLMNIVHQRLSMPVYQHIAPLNDSLVKVNMGGKWEESGAVRGGVWGIMDKQGIVRCELRYEELFAADAQHFWARSNGLWGVIDVNGQIVLPFWYESPTPFASGRAWAKKENHLLLLDEKGGEITRFPGKFRACTFGDDRAWVFTDKEAWLVNTQGEVLQKFKTTAATPFTEQAAWLEQDGRWGLVGTDGKWILPPTVQEIPAATGFPARVRLYQSEFQLGNEGKLRE